MGKLLNFFYKIKFTFDCKLHHFSAKTKIPYFSFKLNRYITTDANRNDTDTYFIVLRIFCRSLSLNVRSTSCLVRVHSEVVVYLRFELAFICLFRQRVSERPKIKA